MKRSIDVLESAAADTTLANDGALAALHDALEARKAELLADACAAALARSDVAEYARLLNDAGASHA